MSPYVASQLVVADLNSSSRMESEFSRGKATRTGRYSLVGAFRSIPSPRIRSMIGPGRGRVEGREEKRRRGRGRQKNEQRQ